MDASRHVETASPKKKRMEPKTKNARARILKDRLVDQVGVEPGSHVLVLIFTSVLKWVTAGELSLYNINQALRRDT